MANRLHFRACKYHGIQFYFQSSKIKKKDGRVGIYLQNDSEYKILKECKFSDPQVIESILVETIVPQGKNIIVDSVHRPPNQKSSLFIETFNEILTIITKNNKHCYVMGNFNLDLLHYITTITYRFIN